MSLKSKKFACPICKENKKRKREVKHLVCILEPDGAVHVHAPFGEPYLMSEFVGAIIQEAEKRRRSQ